MQRPLFTCLNFRDVPFPVITDKCLSIPRHVSKRSVLRVGFLNIKVLGTQFFSFIFFTSGVIWRPEQNFAYNKLHYRLQCSRATRNTLLNDNHMEMNGVL